MAFDGPTPFDGDPAFNYIDEIQGQSPKMIRAAVVRAFEAVGQESESMRYVDVDTGVWAWAAAEMLALALGRPSEPPPPSPFGSAWSIRNPSLLVPAALDALRVVVDPKRSEIAGLWNEQGGPTLERHLDSLLSRLGS
jgi:hypothetical protein